MSGKLYLNYPYYYAKNIQYLASNAKIKNYAKYSKKELCEMLGIKFKKIKKEVFSYTITNIQTNDIKIFKSARPVGRNLNITHHRIINSDRTGQPLVVNGISYKIKKLC